MKQKLAVARAMLHRPEILFLDEPTAGLDPVAAASLRETLGGLVRDEGLTVFLTTHNLTEAEKLCPLVGVINRGKLVALDRPDSLSSRDNAITLEITGPVLPETGIAAIRSLESVSSVTAAPGGISITTTDGRDATPYIRVILEHGGSIEEVRWLANLEDVFLKLVEENAI